MNDAYPYHDTAWRLLNDAYFAARGFESGLSGSFSAAMDAYRDAERFLDEGPGETTDEMHEMLVEIEQKLPAWAIR